MEALPQLDLANIFLATGSDRMLALVLKVFAGYGALLQGIALILLLGLAAFCGAAIERCLTMRRARGRNGEFMPGELAMLRAVVASLPDTIFVKDFKSRFLLANQAAAKNMGAADGADLLGKTDFDFFPQELATGFFEDEQGVLEAGVPQLNKEERIKESDGRTRWLLTTKVPMFDEAGNTVGLIGIGRNITARKLVEAELERTRDELAFKAAHDSLTSLLNREAILESLDREFARSARENGGITVLLADLDHFKNINDMHGHPIGDEVLREVALRLMNSVRSYDSVGRYGGEEFLIVLPGCFAAADALGRAEQLRKDVANFPVHTAKGPISITLSIGVLVTGKWKDISVVDALRQVDAALYAAKDAGRNCCCLAPHPATQPVA
jgi:diguanylate cyclase (GGDEF)-like protein/PAS domain S-box-containing protein